MLQLLAELAKRCVFLPLDFFLLVVFPIRGTAFEGIERRDCCSVLLWEVRRLGRAKILRMGGRVVVCGTVMYVGRPSNGPPTDTYYIACHRRGSENWTTFATKRQIFPIGVFKESLPQSIIGFTQIHQQYYARGDGVMDRTDSKESVSFSSATMDERHHPLNARKNEAKGCLNETKLNGSKLEETKPDEIRKDDQNHPMLLLLGPAARITQ